MQIRLYKTAVGELKIHYCGQCPAHQTTFKRVRINQDYPPKFASAIDYHKCPRTGRRVQFMSIDERCPLPVAGNIEPQRKAEKSGGILPAESTENTEGGGR